MSAAAEPARARQRRLLARLAEPLPRGLDGLAVASPLERRAATAVVLAASVLFTLAAGWELFGPVLAGHYASSASVAIAGENMWRWHIWAPVWEYTAGPPAPSQYYCHHPFGIFWVTALFVRLFGHQDFVARLPAVLASSATPPLLYALGRSLWRPAAGAAAALAFAVVPIALSFAPMNALEVPVTAASLLALWGVVRTAQTARRRWIAVSAVGLLGALHADWPAFVLCFEVLAFLLLRTFVTRRRFFGPLPGRRLAQLWATWATLAVASVALYLAAFQAWGQLDDLLGSYSMRSAGNQASLSAVLASRRYWIEAMFTPVAIALGKVAAPLLLARALLLRREQDLVPLAVLGMALVQYLVFKQGADIHIFWPHYFAAYFALAMGALVATVLPLLELSPVLAPRAPALTAALVAAPLLLVARDGLPALILAHQTGGRFNEKGNLIASDGDKTTFLRWLAAPLEPSRRVDLHEGMKPTWAQVYALGGRLVGVSKPPPKAGASGADLPLFAADLRYLPPATIDELLATRAARVVGPYLAIDPAAPASLRGHAFEEREPSLWERYLVSGTEPVRTIVEDPFVAWEVGTHFGQHPAAPTARPTTPEQRRIAANAARAAGDDVTADALWASLEAELTPLHARFDDGTELVGTTFHPGAQDTLTLYVRAAGSLAPGVALSVRSKVVLPAPWSTTVPDPTEREVALPFTIPPERWRSGFVYSNAIAIRKRPGTEVFYASFSGPRARAPRGPARVDLLTLP